MDKHKYNCSYRPNTTCFKSWSRKSYAVFSSLGVVVHIGNLSVALVQWISQVLGREDEDICFCRREEDEAFDEITDLKEVMLVPVVISADEAVCCNVIRKIY